MMPTLPFRVYPDKSTVICSMASGKYVELLRLTGVTLGLYAQLHGMDSLLVPLETGLDPSRPPMWDKIVLLRRLLAEYETVIWVDADAILCNPWRDVRDELAPGFLVYLVPHHLYVSLVPNTGFMVLKRSLKTVRLLDAIWSKTEFLHHDWWEQAAFMEVIGYDPRDFACAYRGETTFTSCVSYLSNEWNSIDLDPAAEPVVAHFASLAFETRLARMQAKLDEFLARLQRGY